MDAQQPQCDSNQKAEITVDEITTAEDEMKVRIMFMQTLLKLHEERGSPLKRLPIIGHKELDIFRLFVLVEIKGGFRAVITNKLFKAIGMALEFPQSVTNSGYILRNKYEQILLPFEEQLKTIFFRKPPPNPEVQGNSKLGMSYTNGSHQIPPEFSQFQIGTRDIQDLPSQALRRYQQASQNSNQLLVQPAFPLDMVGAVTGTTPPPPPSVIVGQYGSSPQQNIPAQRRQGIPITPQLNPLVSQRLQGLQTGYFPSVTSQDNSGAIRGSPPQMAMGPNTTNLQRYVPQGRDIGDYQYVISGNQGRYVKSQFQREQMGLRDFTNDSYFARQNQGLLPRKEDFAGGSYIEKLNSGQNAGEDGAFYNRSTSPQYQILPPMSKNPPSGGYHGIPAGTVSPEIASFAGLLGSQAGIDSSGIIPDVYCQGALQSKIGNTQSVGLGLKIGQEMAAAGVPIPVSYGVDGGNVGKSKVVRNNIECPICQKLDNYLNFKRHLKRCDFGLYKMMYESNLTLKNKSGENHPTSGIDNAVKTDNKGDRLTVSADGGRGTPLKRPGSDRDQRPPNNGLEKKTLSYIHAKSLLLAKLQLRNSSSVMSNVKPINYLFIHFLFHKLLHESLVAIVNDGTFSTDESGVFSVARHKVVGETGPTQGKGRNLELDQLGEFVDAWPSPSLILDSCAIMANSKSSQPITESPKVKEVKSKQWSIPSFISERGPGEEESDMLIGSGERNGPKQPMPERVERNPIRTPLDKVISEIYIPNTVNTIDVNNTQSMLSFLSWFNGITFTGGESSNSRGNKLEHVRNLVISNFFFTENLLRQILHTHPNLKRIELKTARKHSHRFSAPCDLEKAGISLSDQHMFTVWPDIQSIGMLKHIVIEGANPLFNINQFLSYSNPKNSNSNSESPNKVFTDLDESSSNAQSGSILRTVVLRYHTIAKSTSELLQCRKIPLTNISKTIDPPFNFNELGDIIGGSSVDSEQLMSYIIATNKYYDRYRAFRRSADRGRSASTGSGNQTPEKPKYVDDLPVTNSFKLRQDRESDDSPLFSTRVEGLPLPASNIINTPGYGSSPVLGSSPNPTPSLRETIDRLDANKQVGTNGPMMGPDRNAGNGGGYSIMNFAQNHSFMDNQMKQNGITPFSDSPDMFGFPSMGFPEMNNNMMIDGNPYNGAANSLSGIGGFGTSLTSSLNANLNDGHIPSLSPPHNIMPLSTHGGLPSPDAVRQIIDAPEPNKNNNNKGRGTIGISHSNSISTSRGVERSSSNSRDNGLDDEMKLNTGLGKRQHGISSTSKDTRRSGSNLSAATNSRGFTADCVPTYLTPLAPRHPFIFKFKGNRLKTIKVLRRKNFECDGESEPSHMSVPQCSTNIKVLHLINCIIDMESLIVKCSGVEELKIENCIIVPILQQELTTRLNSSDKVPSRAGARRVVVLVKGNVVIDMLKKKLSQLKHLAVINTIGTFHVKASSDSENSTQFYNVKLMSGDEININEHY